MCDPKDPSWIELRLQEISESRIKKRLSARNPNLPVIDASKFSAPLSELANAMINLVERDGQPGAGCPMSGFSDMGSHHFPITL
jgi:hypothetical protein